MVWRRDERKRAQGREERIKGKAAQGHQEVIKDIQEQCDEGKFGSISESGAQYP